MDVQSGFILTATITVEIHLWKVEIDYEMLQNCKINRKLVNRLVHEKILFQYFLTMTFLPLQSTVILQGCIN